ncbi:hypothetical protein [Billgrantia desiderata]|nr:hypothetical protein [Halomonas desiderata]
MNVHKMFESRGSRRALMVTAMLAGIVVLTGCESQADTQAGAEQGPCVST